jgi:Family of unknown function (DUF5832)
MPAIKNMEDLLVESTSASKWCEAIIKKQKDLPYNSLTNPRDANCVVKDAVANILTHLKLQGKSSLKEVDDSKVKDALKMLLTYLSGNEVTRPSKERPLTDDELDKAFSDLYVDDTYIKVDRKYADPQLRGQNYALYSFVPSRDVQPDADGVYGFIKIRGAFNRVEEAEERAKELIQYFSASKVFMCELGVPTPVKSRVESDNVLEVENPRKNADVVKFTDLMKDQSADEKHQIEEIKQREEQLKEDVAKKPEDKEPIQIYLELSHKRATCAYLYTQHKNKLQETKDIIIATRKQLSDMDEKHPNLKQEYMDHYNKTCADCGIDKATDDMAVMIKKYIGEDPDLDF